MYMYFTIYKPSEKTGENKVKFVIIRGDNSHFHITEICNVYLQTNIYTSLTRSYTPCLLVSYGLSTARVI